MVSKMNLLERLGARRSYFSRHFVPVLGVSLGLVLVLAVISRFLLLPGKYLGQREDGDSLALVPTSFLYHEPRTRLDLQTHKVPKAKAQLPGLNETFIEELDRELHFIERQELHDILETAWLVSQRHGYEFFRLLAQIKAESDFRVDLLSSSGAVGLMQILPSTAEYIGFEDISSIEANLSCGVSYMRYLDKYVKVHKNDRQRWLAKLACYNSGPGNYRKMLKRTRKRTGSIDWKHVGITYRRRFRKAPGSDLPETVIYINRNLRAYERFSKELFQSYVSQ